VQAFYLQTKKYQQYLSPDEWAKFFYSVFDKSKPGNLCFAGKEVFVSSQSVDTFYNAIKLRNELQKFDKERTEIGVITNGTLLGRFKSTLKNNFPDYFDISIDGLPDFHNSIRGAGAFEKLEPNIVWLLRNFNGNIWITHTIFPANIATLPEFVGFYNNKYGLNKFSIGLYKDKYYTDQTIKLSKNNILKLFNETLIKLSHIKTISPIRVILEMDHTQKDLIPLLIDSGLIEHDEPLSSNSLVLNENLTLDINVAFVPVGLWRSVRITPEGYWMAAEDLMEVDKYDKLAVANLRDFNFDTTKLYSAGLFSKRMDALLKTSVLQTPEDKQLKELLYEKI